MLGLFVHSILNLNTNEISNVSGCESCPKCSDGTSQTHGDVTATIPDDTEGEEGEGEPEVTAGRPYNLGGKHLSSRAALGAWSDEQ